jgi:hypothetical protein
MSKGAVEEICFQVSKIFTIKPFLSSLNRNVKGNFTSEEWKGLYQNTRLVQSYVGSQLKSSAIVSNAKKGYVFNDNFVKWLHDFCDYMLLEVDKLKIETVDVSKFFGVSRLTRVLNLCRSDRAFDLCMRYCFYITSDSFKVKKEDLRLIISTFYETMCYLKQTLYNATKNEEMLKQLGLPLDTKELVSFVESSSDLGEVFPWTKTPQGFAYWAGKYLDDDFEYFKSLRAFLTLLDPEFEVKTPEKYTTFNVKKTNKGIFEGVNRIQADLIQAPEVAY